MTHPLGTIRDSKEVELKFHLPAGSRAMLEKYPPLAAVGAVHSHLVSTYFDTPDQILDRSGLTLRVRQDGDVLTQTVKSSSNGHCVAASRGEWEWRISQDKPELAWLAKTKPLAAVALAIKCPLQPAFITDVRRTTRVLHLGGNTMVEVAFDEGDIKAGTEHEAISELELELKSGSVAPLYQLAAALQSLAPLWLMSDSKASRGWRLRTGEGEHAKLAQAPKLRRNVNVAAGFRQLLSGTLGHLTANIGPTLRGDPEGLHQSRIAIRQTRALLRLFDPYLDAITTQLFNDTLQHFAQVFGVARDWDVYCLETLPTAMPELPSDHLEDLNAIAEVERQLAHQVVSRALRDPEFSRLILGLMVWANGKAIGSLRDHGGVTRHRLAILAPVLLHHSAATVTRRGRHVGRLSVVKRHSLRKSLKKLGFDVDYLARFFAGKGVRRYRQRCGALEKILGAANDAVVTDRLTRQLAATGGPEVSQAARAVKRWNRRRGQRSLSKIDGAMQDFRKAPAFWQEG